MQFLLLTIGKWKRAPEHALYDDYAKRLRWPLELRELAGFPALSSDERRRRETELLFASAKEWGADILIALDETGVSLSSSALSERLRQWQDTGCRKIAMVIGGDVGMEKSALAHAHLTVSFGVMTWPHLLVRVMCAEQLYRAHCILCGHPYHRT
jgi:23S rRNA (pseudouridine1915-N3)-methyltransferase